MIEINEPIWNIGYFAKGYKGRGVGIDLAKISGTKTVFKINYLGINKKPLYDNAFEVSKEVIEKLPRKHFKGVSLVYIPLSECSIYKGETVEKAN